MIPILINHDPGKAIGKVEIDGGKMVVTIREDIIMTREWFFEIFGNCGLHITDQEVMSSGAVRIRKGTIIEYSTPAGWPSGARAQVPIPQEMVARARLPGSLDLAQPIEIEWLEISKTDAAYLESVVAHRDVSDTEARCIYCADGRAPCDEPCGPTADSDEGRAILIARYAEGGPYCVGSEMNGCGNFAECPHCRKRVP